MTFKYSLHWLCGAALVLSSVSALGAPIKLTDDEKAVAALKNILPRGVMVKLDLTNPVHEAGVLALMRINGKSESANKRDFQRLEDYKKRQRSIKAGEIAADDPPPGSPVDYLGILGFGGPITNVSAHAFASAHVGDTPNMSVQSNAAISVDDQVISVGQIDTETDVDQKNGSINPRRVEYTTKTPTGVAGLDPKKNNPQAKPVSVVGSASFLVDGVIRNAVLQVEDADAKNVGVSDQKYTDPQPKDPSSGYALLCINRVNPDATYTTPCDYGPLQPNVHNTNANLLVPASGYLKAYNAFALTTDKPPMPANGGSIAFTIYPRQTGGVCTTGSGSTEATSLATAAFMKHVTFEEQNTKLIWTWTSDTEYLDFGALCYKNNSNYDVQLRFSLYDVKAQWVPYTYTSLPIDNPLPYQVHVPFLVFQYGCIIEGTLISLADGRSIPIEDIRPGMLVKSKDGKSLKVRSRTVGTDAEFVQVRTAEKQPLLLTPTHPVLTDRGMVKAKDLSVNDTIYTAAGRSAIQGIEQESRDKVAKVYNLTLEQENGKDIHDLAEATFFAGGVLVGDNAMQGVLEKEKSGNK